MSQADSIQREMVVPHPRDRVWRALTTPASLAAWFGDVAEIDLRPGGRAVFGWTDFGGSFAAEVDVVDPPATFAFRWATLPNTPLDGSPTTLVTFSLAEVQDGTRIRVVETGFAALPGELRQKAIEENTSGWKAEFEDLRRFLLAGEQTRA